MLQHKNNTQYDATTINKSGKNKLKTRYCQGPIVSFVYMPVQLNFNYTCQKSLVFWNIQNKLHSIVQHFSQ